MEKSRKIFKTDSAGKHWCLTPLQLASKVDIESFYKPFNDQTRIRVTVKKKYDVQLSIISLTVSEFAEFIVENEGSVLC